MSEIDVDVLTPFDVDEIGWDWTEVMTADETNNANEGTSVCEAPMSPPVDCIDQYLCDDAEPTSHPRRARRRAPKQPKEGFQGTIHYEGEIAHVTLAKCGTSFIMDTRRVASILPYGWRFHCGRIERRGGGLRLSAFLLPEDETTANTQVFMLKGRFNYCLSNLIRCPKRGGRAMMSQAKTYVVDPRFYGIRHMTRGSFEICTLVTLNRRRISLHLTFSSRWEAAWAVAIMVAHVGMRVTPEQVVTEAEISEYLNAEQREAMRVQIVTYVDNRLAPAYAS